MISYRGGVLPALLLGCCLASGGCSRSPREVLGVGGLVQVDEQPAAEGTAVSFVHVGNDSDTFTTLVDVQGKYSYRPPQGVLLKAGEYVVIVRPKRFRTDSQPGGMLRDIPIPGAPAAYGKYSDVKTSDLRAQLNAGETGTFDIKIVTNQK